MDGCSEGVHWGRRDAECLAKRMKGTMYGWILRGVHWVRGGAECLGRRMKSPTGGKMSG